MRRKNKSDASGAPGTVKRRSIHPPIHRQLLFLLLSGLHKLAALFVKFPFLRRAWWLASGILKLHHWLSEKLWASRPITLLFDDDASVSDRNLRMWNVAIVRESHVHMDNVLAVIAGIVVAFVLLASVSHEIQRPLNEPPTESTSLIWIPSKPASPESRTGGGGGGGERLVAPPTKGELPTSTKNPLAPPAARKKFDTNVKPILPVRPEINLGTENPAPPEIPPGDPSANSPTESGGPGSGGGIGTGSNGGIGSGFGQGYGPGLNVGVGGGPGGEGDSFFRVRWPVENGINICDAELAHYPCPKTGELRHVLNLPPEVIALVRVVVKNADGDIYPETLKLDGLYEHRVVGKKTTRVRLDSEIEKRVERVWVKYWRKWKFPIVYLEKDGSVTPVNGGNCLIEVPVLGKKVF